MPLLSIFAQVKCVGRFLWRIPDTIVSMRRRAAATVLLDLPRIVIVSSPFRPGTLISVFVSISMRCLVAPLFPIIAPMQELFTNARMEMEMEMQVTFVTIVKLIISTLALQIRFYTYRIQTAIHRPLFRWFRIQPHPSHLMHIDLAIDGKQYGKLANANAIVMDNFNDLRTTNKPSSTYSFVDCCSVLSLWPFSVFTR